MKINARKFDALAKEVFAPVYPIIAAQVLERTGVTSGRCLDVGCGGGYLGLAVAERSDLQVTLFDANEEMLVIAQENAAERGLQDRVATLHGDVAAIPLPDASVNLAVSRGSIFFWESPELAFAEIHRVLAPGGRAVLGGGFGNAELKESISRIMEARDAEPGAWRAKVRRNLSDHNSETFAAALTAAGVADYDIDISDDAGLWVTIRK